MNLLIFAKRYNNIHHVLDEEWAVCMSINEDPFKHIRHLCEGLDKLAEVRFHRDVELCPYCEEKPPPAILLAYRLGIDTHTTYPRR